MRILVRSGAVIAAAWLMAGCGKSLKDEGVLPASAEPKVTHSLVKGRTVPHAIITLVPGETPLPMPDQPAVMDQYAKQFIPSVLISRVGQPVEFRNSEDMPHNVTVSRRDSGSQIFTVGTDPHQKYVHTFDRVGQFDVKCDIHEGMEATLIVARGPLTQITDDKGEFAFPNIPVGLYTLSVTSSNGTVEQPLKVQHGVTMLMGGK